VSDLEDAAAALNEAVLLDGSPQADALGEAVAEHISKRPRHIEPPDADEYRRVMTMLRREPHD